MFQISKAQLSVLAESTIDAYLDRVTARIRDDFPDELAELPSRELRLQVEAAFNHFRKSNFQRKEHLHQLIVLELLFGPHFEKRLTPAVQLHSFPPSGMPYPPESERFWALYRAAEQLRFGEALRTLSADAHTGDDV